MPTPTVLILGARGSFGQAATQAFAAAGWQVRVQMRQPGTTSLPAGAQAVDAPLADTAALAARAPGASLVVYAVNPIYTRWDAELLPLFRQGLAVTRALGARFMLPGNVYNYGSGLAERLAEDTPQRPDHAKARLRCEMEAELRRAAGQGLHSVVIRAGDFYGCGSGSWLDQAIVKSIAKGKLVYPGPLDMAHAWAYLPDLAQAFVAVAGLQGRPAFETLHFAGHTLAGHELLAAIEAAAADLGLRPPAGFRHGSLPWGLIRSLGLAVPMMRELARMSYLWRRPHALDGSALQRAVGPLPGTPPTVALRQALRDLGLGTAAAGPQAELC